jgi:hypothetical protein
MPITTIATANDILNQVAAETGIAPVADPFSSNDPSFVQMKFLINTAGDELAQAYPFNILVKEHSFTTDSAANPNGEYPLPDDFYYMINQTGWDRVNNVPLYGPLSSQEWQFLLGADLVSSTIYASFRLNEGLFKLFPTTTQDGIEIHYEYVSKNWVRDATQPIPNFANTVQNGSDTPLYDKTLISRYLKVKFLEAKGFDSTKAQDDFNQTFSFLTGSDHGAKVLYAGGWNRGYPYLDMFGNLPDTGYGYP